MLFGEDLSLILDSNTGQNSLLVVLECFQMLKYCLISIPSTPASTYIVSIKEKVNFLIKSKTEQHGEASFTYKNTKKIITYFQERNKNFTSGLVSCRLLDHVQEFFRS